MALINALPIDEIGRIHPLLSLHADSTHAHGSAVPWRRDFAGAAGGTLRSCAIAHLTYC